MTNMTKEISSSVVIIGAGGHAVSVSNVASSCGMRVAAYVDDSKSGTKVLGIPVITKQLCIDTHFDKNFVIAIGDNSARELIYKEFKSELPNSKFPALIHQSAVVGINSRIGNGAIIMPQANVGPNSIIGEFCIVNTSASIDHDCEMQSFSSLAPRAVTGGGVNIGVRTAVSIGAIIKHGISIGDDVVIGANSYVDKAIGNNIVAYGSPCKVVRTRIKGDSYLDY
jgi:sugar O-acyltransferase (sialic acid O-acetyltransferase NeuD family)